MIGLAVPKAELERIRRESSDELVALFPIKYTVTLTTKGGMMVDGVVITHLELQDWCDMKGYDLFSCDAPPELAKANERTEIG